MKEILEILSKDSWTPVESIEAQLAVPVKPLLAQMSKSGIVEVKFEGTLFYKIKNEDKPLLPVSKPAEPKPKPKPEKIKVGSLHHVCRYSDHGIKELDPLKPYREGVVTGTCRASTCYLIRWSGCSSSQTYHKSFIEIAPFLTKRIIPEVTTRGSRALRQVTKIPAKPSFPAWEPDKDEDSGNFQDMEPILKAYIESKQPGEKLILKAI